MRFVCLKQLFVRRTFLLIAAFTILGAPWCSSLRADAPLPESNANSLKVGAAWKEIVADDSMVIGGGIGPGKVQGQEGRLQATATVLIGNTKLCLVAADILMMNRDYLDQATKRIEQECQIPFDNILINSSHTHHAPSTVTIHGYQRDEEFCRRTVDAIVEAAQAANQKALNAESSQLLFRLGQEATVGQNSRQLLKDGKIYWIGARDGFVRPTGPFDVDLPVIAFRQPSGKYSAVLFNHSTHCIGTRSGKRSASFYGLAAQEISDELATPLTFLSGAAGSTHNLSLDCNEMIIRMKLAVREALDKAAATNDVHLAAKKVEFEYRIRKFDEATEDQAVVDYCQTYAASHANEIISVFRDSRKKLKDQQGQSRKTWLQVVQLGNIYLVAVPAEFFTTLGLEIKRRSPFQNTFVCGLSNDYVGYLPNREAFPLGGYQTWTGLHSFAEQGTGEAIVDECVKLLESMKVVP
ncbi:MAG: hypothetical protein U0930_01335 [Pirellulales bacterium]